MYVIRQRFQVSDAWISPRVPVQMLHVQTMLLLLLHVLALLHILNADVALAVSVCVQRLHAAAHSVWTLFTSLVTVQMLHESCVTTDVVCASC